MAVVVSALLFGLIHMTAEQIPFAVCAGLLLGYIYLKTQSIWSVVIIHAANNLVSYISMYWSARTGDAFLAERNFMILFACLFVVGFISLVVMAIRHPPYIPRPAPLRARALRRSTAPRVSDCGWALPWDSGRHLGARDPMTEHFMEEAIRLALMSAAEQEVPVGAVVVCGGQIVGRGRNRRETLQNALCHARSRRSTKPARMSAAGGCAIAIYT